jgi:hypothetical protein
MKNKAVIALMISAVMVLVLGSAYSQDNMMHVDSSVFSNPQRDAAVFRHDEHNDIAEIDACNECHHIYEDGKKLEDESSEDEQCMDCHKAKSSGNTPSLRKAYHANCKGCHLAKEKGPIRCGNCHVKG